VRMFIDLIRIRLNDLAGRYDLKPADAIIETNDSTQPSEDLTSR